MRFYLRLFIFSQILGNIAGEKVDCNLIMTALQNDYIRIFFAWLNIFFVHWLYGGGVLSKHGINASSPFLHIPQNPSSKPDIGIRINKYLHIHKIAKLLVFKDKYSLDYKNFGRF